MAGDIQEDIHSFEDFYTAKIASLTGSYREKSNSSNLMGIAAFVLLLSAIALFIASIMLDDFGVGAFFAFILLLIFIYCINSYAKSEDDFNDNFKMKVINEIAQYIIPGVKYEPHKFINSKLYKASSLYRRRYIHISGDDLMTGVYKNVPFKASELCTQYRSGRYLQSIFEGIFFVAEIGRFTGGTYIWPKDDVQLPVSIADEHFRLMPMPQVSKIYTGNPDFDKHYVVYSTYPAEAALILSGDMLQRMLNLKKQLKKDIRFSFVAGRFYATVENKQDMLEPVEDLEDKESIKEYFFTILLYPALINQLRLYEYI